ncbi:MAG: hypothetical protein ACRC33_04735 [Gemmataceae bacterium]
MVALIVLCLAAGPPSFLPLPARVSATFRDAKLEDVFTEIRKQTGYRLRIDDNHADHHQINRTFTGSFRDATYWEAVDAICRHCGAETFGTYLWPAPAEKVISRCHGLFRVTVTEVVLSRPVRPAKEDGGEARLKVVLELDIEPRYRRRFARCTVEEATDDRKCTLLLDTKTWGAEEAPTSDGEAVLYLKTPAAGVKRIALLKGTIRVKVRICQASHVIEVPFEVRDLPLP